MYYAQSGYTHFTYTNMSVLTCIYRYIYVRYMYMYLEPICTCLYLSAQVVDTRQVRVLGGWDSHLDANRQMMLAINQTKRFEFDVSGAGPGLCLLIYYMFK